MYDGIGSDPWKWTRIHALTEHPPRQWIHNSNNLNLTCISEAGGKWWRGFVSTGQIMSSQPDVDRWRQRLALPPELCYTHTHLATSFSQDNYLATSASPHRHTHTHAPGQLRTHTRNDNRRSPPTHTHTHTHVGICHGVRIHTLHNPSSVTKYGNQLCLWRAWHPAAAEDRQTHTLLHIWQGFFLFFFPLLFAWSYVQFTAPLSALLIPLSLIIFS